MCCVLFAVSGYVVMCCVQCAVPCFRLREEAVKRLCWFLANESGGSERLPNMNQLDVRQLPALFIVETPHYLDEENTRSVFQVSACHFWQLLGSKSSKMCDLCLKLSGPVLESEKAHIRYFTVCLHHDPLVASDNHQLLIKICRKLKIWGDK